MARQRVRLRGRFFLILFGMMGFVALGIVLLTSSGGTAEARYGDVTGTIDMTAAIIRDESTVSTDRYEKIIFSVVEGQSVANGAQIAQVFRLGYQDESTVTLLRLQREIYEYQKSMIGADAATGLADIETRIADLEAQIRDAARGDSDADMLQLEQSLKSLQTERATYLQNNVQADATLTSLYSSLAEQENALSNWTRNIVNSAGNGVVSFYFDGYERVLNASQIDTINAALINSVVRGGNTASSLSTTTSETPLYRLVQNTHWYIAFVTRADEPMRTTAGEQYYVVFDDYSTLTYQGTALAPIVTESSVVNILEFNVDIGDLLDIRTVNAIVTKSAQGVMVPVDAIAYEAGIPSVEVQSGEATYRVTVNILAADEDNAVVAPVNASDTLISGQRIIKP